ncbi:hypothetical protein B0O40_0680 [Ruminococcaceae bacterium R-25]|nr:hypothetical protein B0O40_0680 [Ruminococcaceae bacterium R-25]SUQ11309.1 hypothetical protein SAMN06297423_0680 [Oscillospiraceae bacterium]
MEDNNISSTITRDENACFFEYPAIDSKALISVADFGNFNPHVEEFLALIVNSFRSIDSIEVTSTVDSAKESDSVLSSYLKLGQIKRLSDNWNGCGARAFDSKLIFVINKLIPMLIKQPEIFPTGRNTIQLEYDGAEGAYLEIEIVSENLANFLFIDKNGNEKEYSDVPNEQNINNLVKELYG